MDFPAEPRMRRLLVHTAAHAVVDFACFYVLLARFLQHVTEAEQLALAMSAMISFIVKLCAPLVWLLTVSTNGVLRLIGIAPPADDEP